jgi:hypothetical protein
MVFCVKDASYADNIFGSTVKGVADRVAVMLLLVLLARGGAIGGGRVGFREAGFSS